MWEKIVDTAIWLSRTELVVIVGLLIVVLGTWGFIELADEVLEGQTQQIDERILRALRRPEDPAVPVGPSWLAETGRDVTALGGVAVLLFLTVAVAGFLWLNQQRRAMVLVLAATLGGLAVSQALKALFARPRPAVVPHLVGVYSSSFPSGHSMLSAVVYLTLGTLLTRFVARRRLKFYFLSLAVFLTLAVGVSRVYLGVHYPPDVLAGWTAGLVWALLCWLIARRLQFLGTIESVKESPG